MAWDLLLPDVALFGNSNRNHGTVERLDAFYTFRRKICWSNYLVITDIRLIEYRTEQRWRLTAVLL